MAVSIAYDNSNAALTVSNTELSLVSGTSSLQTITTAGVYQVFLDPVTNLAKGDEFSLKIYEKARSGGTKRVVFQMKISDAQAELWCTPPLMLINGWDVTLIRTAGSDRAFDYSIRKAG
jgi:hypothetical protein